jgi:hypothetical protein
VLGAGETEAKPTEAGAEAKATELTSAEIELKLPEGIKVDDTLFSEFKTVAKELGLDSAKAQRLLDLQVRTAQDFDKKVDAAWEQTRTEWVEKAKSDKEFGGANYDASIKSARLAVNKFGGAEFKKFLNDFGIGDHPELIRFMAHVGKAFGEDRTAGTTAAGTSAPQNPTQEDILRARYPSMFTSQ